VDRKKITYHSIFRNYWIYRWISFGEKIIFINLELKLDLISKKMIWNKFILTLNFLYYVSYTIISFLLRGRKNTQEPPKLVKKESAGERTTRELLETRLGKPFVKVRPDWLRGDKGRNLELDGYCEELNLAFEYNGAQHYSKKHFGMTEKKFVEQVFRDRKKYTELLKRGIRCIILEKTAVEKIEEEISNQLQLMDANLYRRFARV
jgi:hypothetical protein